MQKNQKKYKESGENKSGYSEGGNTACILLRWLAFASNVKHQ